MSFLTKIIFYWSALLTMSIPSIVKAGDIDLLNNTVEKIKPYSIGEPEAFLSIQEVILANAMIKADVDGRVSINTIADYLEEDFVNIYQDTYQLDYEENQIRSDLIYKNKDILVTGKARSVRVDREKNLIVELKTTSKGHFTIAKMSKDYNVQDYLANIRRGDWVDLVCVGYGFNGFSAILGDCIPLKKFKNILQNSLIDMVARFNNYEALYATIILYGNEDSLGREVKLLVPSLHIIAAKMLAAKGVECTESNDECLKRVVNAYPSLSGSAEEDEVLDDLVSHFPGLGSVTFSQ